MKSRGARGDGRCRHRHDIAAFPQGTKPTVVQLSTYLSNYTTHWALRNVRNWANPVDVDTSTRAQSQAMQAMQAMQAAFLVLCAGAAWAGAGKAELALGLEVPLFESFAGGGFDLDFGGQGFAAGFANDFAAANFNSNDSNDSNDSGGADSSAAEYYCEDKYPSMCSALQPHGYCSLPKFEYVMFKECRKTCGMCPTASMLENRDRENPSMPLDETYDIFSKLVGISKNLGLQKKYGVSLLGDPSVLPILKIDRVLTKEQAAELRTFQIGPDLELGPDHVDELYMEIGGPETYSLDDRTGACRHACIESPLARAATLAAESALEEILGIKGGRNYAEHFHVRTWQEGGLLAPHIDFDPWEVFAPAGPRLFSFVIWLNDVEGGGETWWSHEDANITQSPPTGSALLWPNTLRFDPWKKNPKSVHQVLPVKKGTMTSLVNGVHLYPFRKHFPVDI